MGVINLDDLVFFLCKVAFERKAGMIRLLKMET